MDCMVDYDHFFYFHYFLLYFIFRWWNLSKYFLELIELEIGLVKIVGVQFNLVVQTIFEALSVCKYNQRKLFAQKLSNVAEHISWQVLNVKWFIFNWAHRQLSKMRLPVLIWLWLCALLVASLVITFTCEATDHYNLWLCVLFIIKTHLLWSSQQSYFLLLQIMKVVFQNGNRFFWLLFLKVTAIVRQEFISGYILRRPFCCIC